MEATDSFLPKISSRPLPAGLYIVATPIGNLEDITLRALRVLHQADVIACEDTRVTSRLLQHYGIATPTLSYHEHNAARQRPVLMGRLGDGARVALVSDAGTPLISDPGYKLVEEALQGGHSVVPIPGASSVSTALCAAGLPTDHFYFAGFLPHKSTARKKIAAALKNSAATLVFFDSAQRITESLADLAAELGPRQAVIARELTKLHEEWLRGTLESLHAECAARHSIKGEIVLLVAPPDDAAPQQIDLDSLLAPLLAEYTLRDAVTQAVRQTGLARQIVYARALALRDHPKGASDDGATET